jgi:hypothetical protein
VHLDHLATLLSSLAADAVVAFVIAVIADDFIGVFVAIRKGVFSWNKLPSFLESQFGTRQAAALAGTVVMAYLTGQVHDLAQAHAAALAVVTAGGGALTLSVLKDAISKLQSLISAPTPAVVVKA